MILFADLEYVVRGSFSTDVATARFAPSDVRLLELVRVTQRVTQWETRVMNAPQKTFAMLAGVFAFAGISQTSAAEGETVSTPRVTQDRVETTGPNRALLHSGIWILGLSYVPAVIVAAESTRHGDKNLYVPIAGPWMDLATRTDCPANETCNNETANQALIIVDGVFQAIGALNLAGAFLFSETRTVTVGERERRAVGQLSPTLRLVPARVTGSAYGLVAIGAF